MPNSAELFKALADDTRLRILNLLSQGELCVCDIMTILGVGQSKVSRHLACLRHAGLVNDRRKGVWMHYSLAHPTGIVHRRIVAWLAEASSELPQATADLKALRAVHREIQRNGRCPNDNGHNQVLVAAVQRASGV